MRMLFLSTWFPHPPDNGSKQRVCHLLRALGRQHGVTLASFAFGTAQPQGIEAERLGCEAVSAVVRNPFERGQLAWGLRFLSPRPIVEAPLREMTECVGDLLAVNRFDVVIASTTLMAPYARMAGEAGLVLEEHNCWSRWARERYEATQSPLRRLRLWVSWQKRRHYEAQVYRGFDLCTMVSELDRGEAVQILGGDQGRVEVIPNGVDCEHNRPGMGQGRDCTLVFNGSLTYSANYDAVRWFLDEVYPLVQQEMPQVTLTITGSLEGIDLSTLNLDASVHLSGHVADVRPLVARASACVVPMRQGGGTRIKILEAMALGTPVVSTAKGAEGLAVTPEHDILIADPPAGFAFHVVRLLRDPGLQHHVARNARGLVEQRYDWPRIGERFVEVVQDVVWRQRA